MSGGLKLAQVLLVEARFEEARAEFETCLAVAPNDPEVLTGMARCTQRLGAPAEARSYAEAALARSTTPGQQSAALLELGRWEYDAGETKAAIGSLAEAVRLNPADNTAHYLLARALTRDGQTGRAQHHTKRAQQARADFDRMSEIRGRLLDRPNDADLRAEAGAILMRQGMSAEGLAWLRTALGCDPHHAKAHQILAEYYAAKGDQRSAAHHRLMAAAGGKGESAAKGAGRGAATKGATGASSASGERQTPDDLQPAPSRSSEGAGLGKPNAALPSGDHGAQPPGDRGP